MKIWNYLFILGLALFLGFTTISCETVKPNAETKTKTKGFLATTDLALKSWLKKRFSVRYDSISPQLIFETEPLEEIHVRSSNLPTDAQPFSLNSPGISRRELLKKIADFWDLEMSIHTDSEGTPIFISATGKAESSEDS